MKDIIVIHIIVYRRTDVNYFQIFNQILQIFCDVYKKKTLKIIYDKFTSRWNKSAMTFSSYSFRSSKN